MSTPDDPREHARALVLAKDGIEAELDAQYSILRANNCDMTTSLVDPEGFPRADLDIYAIRTARARIIVLRNDLKSTMDEIERALHEVYDPSSLPPPTSTSTQATDVPSSAPSMHTEEKLSPFAKVDGVAPDSPAAQAGLHREDLIVKFGSLTRAAFSSSSLERLADLVGRSENHELRVQVLRQGEELTLQFTPRKWGGRGLLGCHIVPFSAS